MTYDYVDAMISYMDKRLVRMFSPLKSLLSYDEINAITAVTEVYANALRMAKASFLQIANNYYAESRFERDMKSLDEQWVDEILESFDPVSKYIFSSEYDRKRMRLFEALVASPTKVDELKAAVRSVSFMLRIYAVRMADEAVTEAMKDEGVAKVEWVAEMDNKTCPICWKRDGRIYELLKLPPKPHPNCRCWIKAVAP